jgi:hypothetical protein
VQMPDGADLTLTFPKPESFLKIRATCIRGCSPWRVENGTMVFMADDRRLNLPLLECPQEQIEFRSFRSSS